MVKKNFLISLFCLCSVLSGAQESTVTKNYEGKDFSMLKHTWKAQWVTHPTETTLDYGVFNFRRSFQLDSIGKTFIVHVSADNRYRLFVNGAPVAFGPSIGDIDHYRYETLDIAKHLKTGENIIAAEVVNFGEHRRGAQQSFMTAFILQGDDQNGVDINTGSSDWKVSRNMAYTCIPFNSDSLYSYYAAGPGENITFNKYPWGWESLDFDDSKWASPRLATVEFAVGRGFLYGSTWYLVPRTIPMMESSPGRFDHIVRTTKIECSDEFLFGNESIVVPPHTRASILIDHKTHTVGYPELIHSKGLGSKLKLTYAEALVYNDAYTTDFVNGNFSLEDLKGNRDVTEGKKIFGIYDILYPDGGENRLFRPLWMKTFRYIQIDIETQDEALILNDFKYEFSAYPFEEIAKFNTGDEFFRKLWDVAWRTVRNGSGEMFQDSPYYEQLQYTGDTRLESIISLYVSGDDRLMRKAIQSFDDSRMPNGLTQSRYPAYINQVIPTYSLLWISMLHDYHMYRNNPEFIEPFLPGIRGVLQWFEDRIDSSDMPTNLEWWNFTDWVAEFPNGIPPGADDGYSANISLQMVYALDNATELFSYFGWKYEAEKYAALSDRIKKAVYRDCFDADKQMFAETADKDLFSQHTNIMAVLTNSIDPKFQKDLIEKVLHEKDVVHTSIYFKFYLFRALQKVGMGNEYFSLLDPWKNMLDAGLTTFAETDVNPRSDCHAWSATPCFDMLSLVAGINPDEPGFKTISIKPNFGYLDKIDVQMPHPEGIISMNLSKDKHSKVEGRISLPKNTSGIFIWREKQVDLVAGENIIKLK